MSARLLYFIIGVLCVLAVLIFYKKQKNSTPVIFTLVIGAFFLRLSASLFPYLHEWDERYHALVAKNLGENFLSPRLYPVDLLDYNYQDWSANFIWLHKQPFPLWCIAASLKLFGNNEFAVRLPSILLSTAAVLLTFFIGKWLFSYRIGIWAAVFHSLNGLIIEMTGGGAPTDHIDIFFMFFIELSIFLSVLSRYKLANKMPAQTLLAFLTGITIGIALLCKWLPALIVVPIYALLHWKGKNWLLNTGYVIISAAMVACPWQLYAVQNFPLEYGYEMDYNKRHFWEVLEGHAHAFYYHFDRARIFWNEMVYLPLLWLIIRILKKTPQPSLLLLAVWIFIPYLFFSIAATKMPAYTLFTGPAVFVVQALFIRDIQYCRVKPLGLTIKVLFFLLAFRYCFERVKPFEKESADIAAKREMVEYLKNKERTVVLNVEDYVEIMFYTDCIAYNRVPTPAEIQKLVSLGYNITIVNGENIPATLRTDPNIQIL